MRMGVSQRKPSLCRCVSEYPIPRAKKQNRKKQPGFCLGSLPSGCIAAILLFKSDDGTKGIDDRKTRTKQEKTTKTRAACSRKNPLPSCKCMWSLCVCPSRIQPSLCGFVGVFAACGRACEWWWCFSRRLKDQQENKRKKIQLLARSLHSRVCFGDRNKGRIQTKGKISQESFEAY